MKQAHFHFSFHLELYTFHATCVLQAFAQANKYFLEKGLPQIWCLDISLEIFIATATTAEQQQHLLLKALTDVTDKSQICFKLSDSPVKNMILLETVRFKL